MKKVHDALNVIVPPILCVSIVVGFFGVCWIAFEAGRMLAKIQ